MTVRAQMWTCSVHSYTDIRNQLTPFLLLVCDFSLEIVTKEAAPLETLVRPNVFDIRRSRPSLRLFPRNDR